MGESVSRNARFIHIPFGNTLQRYEKFGFIAARIL